MSANKVSILTPAIVLGTHTMGLGVIRSLGMMGIPVVAVYYDCLKDMGYVSKYVKYKIFVPHPENDEKGFIESLVETASRFGGGLLIPVSDETLVKVSKYRDLLASHYIVACAEWDVTKQIIDKKYTYAMAEAVGVGVPKTLVPQSIEDVHRYGAYIDYPCLVKPSQSHLFFAKFGRKMVTVGTQEEMISIYQQSNEAGIEVMLQEIIPGEDSLVVNYNSYAWDGQPLVEFTAQHIRKAPPEFGSPCVAVSKQIPEVIDAGRRVLRTLGFNGYSCTEFKKDPRDGVFKLMEVNGRHNLSTLLAVNCGINFPWLHYRHLVNGIIPEQTGFREGLFWIDMERDVPGFPKRIIKQKESLSQLLMPYLKPHVFAVFDRKDLRPFFKRYANFFQKAVNYLFKKNSQGDQ